MDRFLASLLGKSLVLCLVILVALAFVYHVVHSLKRASTMRPAPEQTTPTSPSPPPMRSPARH